MGGETKEAKGSALRTVRRRSTITDMLAPGPRRRASSVFSWDGGRKQALEGLFEQIVSSEYLREAIGTITDTETRGRRNQTEVDERGNKKEEEVDDDSDDDDDEECIDREILLRAVKVWVRHINKNSDQAAHLVVFLPFFATIDKCELDDKLSCSQFSALFSRSPLAQLSLEKCRSLIAALILLVNPPPAPEFLPPPSLPPSPLPVYSHIAPPPIASVEI